MLNPGQPPILSLELSSYQSFRNQSFTIDAASLTSFSYPGFSFGSNMAAAWLATSQIQSVIARRTQN